MQRAAGWTLLGGAASRVLTLFGGVIAARILTKAGFGRFSAVQSTAILVLTFTNLGLGTTAARTVAAARAADVARLGRIVAALRLLAVALGVVGAFVLVALSRPIAAAALGDVSLAPALIAASALVLAQVLLSTERGILSGFERFSAMAYWDVAAAALGCALIAVGARFAGVLGAVVGISIPALLNAAMAARITNRLVPRSPKRFVALGSEMRSLMAFGVPVMLAGAFFVPATWLTNVLLIGSGGYAEFGAFSVAQQWRAAILFVPTTVCVAFMPIATSLSMTAAPRFYRRFQLANLAVAGCSSCGALLGLALTLPLVLGLYGPTFRTAGPSVLLMGAAAVGTALCQALSNDLTARGAVWTNALFSLAAGALLLSLAFGFGGGASARGMAMCYCFSAFIVLTIQGVYQLVWRPRHDRAGNAA